LDDLDIAVGEGQRVGMPGPASRHSLHQVLREQVFPAASPSVLASLVQVDLASAPHSHAFVELAVVVGGRGVHESATGRWALSRGSVVLMLPGEWHGYDDCRQLRVWNLYVAPEVRDRELSGLRGDRLLGKALWASSVVAPSPGSTATTGPRRPVGSVSEVSLDALEPALRRLGGDQSGYPGEAVARIGLLLEVLAPVCAALVVEPGEVPLPAGTKAHPALLSAVRLLEEWPTRPWKLPVLAGEVNLSPEYLARLFTQQLGISPIAYLTRVRAERAAALLIEGDASVAEIGRLVGWPDPSYASRRFSSVFGRSPQAYRRAFRPPREPAALSSHPGSCPPR